MLLTKLIQIKINTKKDRTYHKLGYYKKNDRKDDILLNIKINDLKSSSRELVHVRCDICGNEKKISYYKYLKNIEKYNIYSCVKCSSFKNKLTKLDKYGEKNYNNREKFKSTCLEKYGVENPQQNQEIRIKTLITNMAKYGGVSPRSSKEIQKKQKKTTIKKYGKNYYFNWRKNIKFILFDKYGDMNYNNREKNKTTCLEKYGVENPMLNDEIKNKAKEKRIKNGSYHTNESRSNYKNYWLEVKKTTNKYKKELFNKWSGFDYYDNEYIKDNFNLNSGNKNYPTIDHKISVKYGYDNNILPSEIGFINNLCITKRTINSRKNQKNYIEFKK